MSWESILDCPCYQFLIIAGKQNIKMNLNHTYTLNIKIKKSDGTYLDATKFEKQIEMNTEVEHILKDYAAVYKPPVDDFINSATPPEFTQWTEDLIPWAELVGYKGAVETLSTTLRNNGVKMANSTLNSVWRGNLNESVDSKYATLDFANINIDAYHLTIDECNLEANTTSSKPVGWAEVAYFGGFKAMWVDYVGFFNHLITKTQKAIDITSIKDVQIEVDGKATVTDISYNVLGHTSSVGGDLKTGDVYWQVANENNIDPYWDGEHLGWSHWIMENAIYSRWVSLRDEVMSSINGARYVAKDILVKLLPLVGNWVGSISKSRKVDEKEYILLSSDKVDSKLYTYTNNTLEELEKPEGLEDKIYPICPL